MSKKVYGCNECGGTHYNERMPKKCKYCGRTFNINDKEKLEMYQV